MARWDFSVVLNRGRSPLFLQIARAISDDISRGRLRPGDALPGTRTLAHSLGVQRQTVVAAFDELLSEGWIVTEPARGTFVAAAIPEAKPRRFDNGGAEQRTVSTSPIFELPTPPAAEQAFLWPRGTLFFSPTRPDVRLVPADMIGRAYRRAIRRGGGALLSYAEPHGHPRLRKAIATMISARRGIAATAENICVTRGSQMALALAARAILRPGDLVVVEELGYRPAWEAFRLAGATVVSVPVDENGISIDAIERLHGETPVRAIYVMPHHQLPTTVTLTADRRVRLLAFAARARIALIEDDYDHEFHYDGQPVTPLMSADWNGVVVYIGSLSKVLAPALRTGYVVGPSALIDAIAAHRSMIDLQGDQILEYALGELFEEGAIQRHIRRVRREYAARRDEMILQLRRQLGTALQFVVPAGGIAIWARVAEDIDVRTWADEAARAGAVAITARPFAFDGEERPFFRLGFAALRRPEIAEGVRRLAAARPPHGRHTTGLR